MAIPHMSRTYGFVVLFWALLPLPLSAQETPAKQPIPDRALVEAAEKLVRSLFQAEYARRKPAEMHELGAKLFEEALATKDDAAAQFVLLREAQDLLAKSGDYLAAFKAIDEMDRRFVFNMPLLKALALEAASRAALPGQDLESLARTALAVADDALASDDFAAARRLVAIAEGAARKLKNVALVSSIQAWSKAVDARKKEFERLQPALALLQTKPDDPEANARVGRYLALYKGDWERGLPHLAKGNDAQLRELAIKDQEAGDDGAAQVAAGDGWYDLAAGQDEATKAKLLLRAKHWYRRASAGTIAGLTKFKVDKRLAELESQTPVETSQWIVLFRSADPRIWNRNWNDKSGFATDLRNAPAEMQYLRLTNVKSGESVIVPVTRDNLLGTSDDGRYGWNGTNKQEYGGYHLGIYDTTTDGKKVDPFACVLVPGAFRGYSGWGFAHLSNNRGPGYAWDAVAIQPTAFEIAVTSGKLTDAESQKLLRK